MLHPNQFQVNQAWILFKLNDAPIVTEADGDFNLFALMDAASCFILGSVTVSVTQVEPSKIEVERLLKEARAHKQMVPEKLFIPNDQAAGIFILEAERQGIVVMRVAIDQLQTFIGDAQEGFKEKFGGGSTH